MAVLNMLSAQISVNAPGGMWEFFLKIFGFIANYGWRIILFTVILKLVLSPLDFFQKYKMKKNQRITKSLQPEIERLQKQYANDKQALMREQGKLQKGMGFSYLASCIPMIITLVVFFTFFAGMRNISQYEEFKQYVNLYGTYSTEYTRLTGIEMPGFEKPEQYDDAEFNVIIIAEYDKNPEQFKKDTKNTYQIFIDNNYSFKQLYDKKIKLDGFLTALDNAKDVVDSVTATDEAKRAAITVLNENQDLTAYRGGEYNIADLENAAVQIKENISGIGNVLTDLKLLVGEGGIILGFAEQRGSEAAAKYYDEHNNSFLWIKSLWVADSPFGEPIPNFDTFSGTVSKYLNQRDNAGGLSPELLNTLNTESTYNNVMKIVREKPSATKPNGYFILAILAVGFSLLSQLIMTRQQKKSGQANVQGGSMMKIMMFIMPAMTGVFAIMYTSSFAIYMITNSIMSLLINLLSTLVLGGIFRGKDKGERSDTGIVKYGRKDPNDYRRK